MMSSLPYAYFTLIAMRYRDIMVCEWGILFVRICTFGTLLIIFILPQNNTRINAPSSNPNNIKVNQDNDMNKEKVVSTLFLI